MGAEHEAGVLAVMRLIKQAIDPENLMNLERCRRCDYISVDGEQHKGNL
ncbi:MAG: hypothetical protein QM730_03030 [Anaerolineales bacterium]